MEQTSASGSGDHPAIVSCLWLSLPCWSGLYEPSQPGSLRCRGADDRDPLHCDVFDSAIKILRLRALSCPSPLAEASIVGWSHWNFCSASRLMSGFSQPLRRSARL
jgi:hypothetical protein